MQGRPPHAPEASNVLTDVVSALGRLLRGEIALARAEIKQGLRAAVVGLVMIVVAVILLVTAIQLFAGAGVAGLVHIGLRPWQAAVLLGGALLVVAVVLVMTGLRRLGAEAIVPQRAFAGLRRDVETLNTKVTPDAT